MDHKRTGKVFTIKSNDNQVLLDSLKKFELVSPLDIAEEWTQAFEHLDMVQHMDFKPPRSSKRTEKLKAFEKEVLSNDFYQQHAGKVQAMVKSYMKIVDKTILDMAPKYIVMSLVQAVRLQLDSFFN